MVFGLEHARVDRHALNILYQKMRRSTNFLIGCVWAGMNLGSSLWVLILERLVGLFQVCAVLPHQTCADGSVFFRRQLSKAGLSESIYHIRLILDPPGRRRPAPGRPRRRACPVASQACDHAADKTLGMLRPHRRRGRRPVCRSVQNPRMPAGMVRGRWRSGEQAWHPSVPPVRPAPPGPGGNG